MLWFILLFILRNLLLFFLRLCLGLISLLLFTLLDHFLWFLLLCLINHFSLFRLLGYFYFLFILNLHFLLLDILFLLRLLFLLLLLGFGLFILIQSWEYPSHMKLFIWISFLSSFSFKTQSTQNMLPEHSIVLSWPEVRQLAWFDFFVGKHPFLLRINNISNFSNFFLENLNFTEFLVETCPGFLDSDCIVLVLKILSFYIIWRNNW